MQVVKSSNKGKHFARRRRLGSHEGRGPNCRLYPPVTIDLLPDNVLLETFEFYLGIDDADEFDHDHNYDGWQTLVHVCHRWRCIAFASPRRLGLKLYCTRQRSATSKTLDIWPALPIVVVASDTQSKENMTNIIDALRQHNRVCKISFFNEQFQDSLLKEFVAIDEPFPALTSLRLELSSSQRQNVPILPDSFLGGSAPRLRSLHLNGIPYPSIGKLLVSTANLVQLSLWRIPHSGYISPEMIVPVLSTLSRLESLGLGFQHPRSGAHRASRHPPPLTRVVLPSLTCLSFNGNVEYLEDILSQIETPMLNQSKFCFFNQLVFDTPILGRFIRRTETFMTIHTARVQFSSSAVAVRLSGREGIANDDREALWLEITCNPLDWQLSALPQVLNSFLPSLQTLERLEITISRLGKYYRLESVVEVQWQEFLHPFASVETITLTRLDSVCHLAPALQALAQAGESASEVLPALRHLFVRVHWKLPGSIEHGRPVIVYY